MELRARIWAIVACEPRAVLLSFEEKPDSARTDRYNIIPSILHTSSEARTEGLKYYKLYAKEDLVKDNVARLQIQGHDDLPKVYINFDVDWFKIIHESFFDWADLSHYLSIRQSPVFSKIKNLQIKRVDTISIFHLHTIQLMSSLQVARIEWIYEDHFKTSGFETLESHLYHAELAALDIRAIRNARSEAVSVCWELAPSPPGKKHPSMGIQMKVRECMRALAEKLQSLGC